MRDFHVVPAVVGAKRGTGKILLGVALLGAAVFTGGAALAAAGGLGAGVFGGSAAAAGLAGALGLASQGLAVLGGLALLSGTYQAITKIPKTNADMSSTDDKPGYLFNGAINTSQQGGVIPLVFGRLDAGSVIVSAGVSSERLAATVPTSAGPDVSGQIGYTTNLA